MADVNKSIEITMRANLKQLEEGLKSIPNMTKKEAQQMTRALASEFNKAQKAAKKAAEESKKAAKSTTKAYEDTFKKTKTSFEGMADSAKASAHEVKVSFENSAQGTNRLADGAESVATSFGAADLAVNRLIPDLDAGAKRALEMADGLATAAEQAIKGGPVTIALTAAVVGLTLGYDLATREARNNLKVTKEQLKGYANLSTEIKRVTKAVLDFSEAERLDILEKIRSVRRDTYDFELQSSVIKGEISETEAKILESKNKQSRLESDLTIQLYRANLQRKEDIKTLEGKLDLLDKESHLLSDIRLNDQASVKDKKEAEIRQGKIFQEQEKIREAIEKINDENAKYLKTSFEIEKVVKARGEAERAAITAQQRKNNALKKEEELQERLKEGREAIMSFDEQAEAARQASKDIMMSVLPAEEQIAIKAKEQSDAKKKQIDDIEAQLRLLEATAQTEEERLQLSFAEESAAAAITEIKKEQQLIEEEGLLKIEELRLQIQEKRKKDEEEIAQRKKKQIDDEIKHLSLSQELTIGTFRNMTNAVGAIMDATGSKNKELIRTIFQANKIASIGEIAFNTAKAITAAQAYPPPINGIMIASAIAQGAGQTAIVMSQQPPQFHMGGMTPDESIAVVKAGEAVLDRATVDRLGGEPGVNRLQNGQKGSAEVIVLNPYKHFDRYMTDRQRAGLSSRSARRGY